MGSDDEPSQVQPGERARSLIAVESLLRMQRIAVDHFAGDDLETITVLLTVVAGSVPLSQHDDEALRALEEGPLPEALFRPVSGRGVAASCGLPRETVRRRLEQLVADGRIKRDERGYHLVFDTMSRNRNLEFVRALTRELEAAPRRLARFDPP